MQETKASKKINALLKRYSQRELAREVGTGQPGICLIAAGKRRNPRKSTKRNFERVGVKISDWDS